MGLFDSLFGKKTKTKSQSDPWDEVIPFLTGKDGKPGVFPEAANLFEQNKNNPVLEQMTDAFGDLIQGRIDKPEFGQVTDPGMFALNGNMDAAFNPVGNTQQRGNVPRISNTGFTVKPQNVDLTGARASQGRLDPSMSMLRMLSGRPDTAFLNDQFDAITGQLTRNLNENVMPGIRSEALAAGQYGGSRQGIAEGLAASRLNQDLAPAFTGLLGNSFENAQQRMFGTANALNDQAVQNATNNVNRDFAGQQFNANMNMQQAMANSGIDQFNAGLNQGTDQFNANLGLQNNNQLMQSKDQQLNNRMQGLNMLQGGLDMQDNQFSRLIDNALLPRQLAQDNLNNYANTMFTGAQLGNQATSKTTQTPGIIPAALGTVSALAGLARGGMGGMGGGGGGFFSTMGGGR